MLRRASMVRPDWWEQACQSGFIDKAAQLSTYWDETALYVFSRDEINKTLAPAIQELHNMCLAFVDWASQRADVMLRLGVPEPLHDRVRASWVNGCRAMMGRFDLVYDGSGPPKMLEYNADTPGTVYETGFFQLKWLEDMQGAGRLPRDADQYNHLQTYLVDFFKSLPDDVTLHFSTLPEAAEDFGNLAYIRNCADHAGCRTRFTPLDALRLGPDNRFVAEDGQGIDVLFRYYPWEWMVHEELGQVLPHVDCVFVEPEWKMLLASKAMLPYLWQLFPHHPLLLPSYFADDPDKRDLSEKFVLKPVFAREGANIVIVEGGDVKKMTSGPYAGQDMIAQSYCGLPVFDGNRPLIGGWVIDNKAAGICVREDASEITNNLSRFVPHIVL